MSKALETLRTGLVGCALAAALFGAFAALKANACTAMVTGDAAEIAFDRPVSGWEREYRGEGFSLKSWWMGPEVAGESAWATESLPIGNGWFGATVFFSCDTNWSFDPQIMLSGVCEKDPGLPGRVEGFVRRAAEARRRYMHLEDCSAGQRFLHDLHVLHG